MVRICSGLGPIQMMLWSSTISANCAFSDGVGVCDLRRRDDVGHVEVGVGGRRRADADRFVGEPHVHRIGVRCRMDRDRLDPHFVAGAVDPERDLAAIGDQDLLDRHVDLYSMITSGWSNSTGCAFSTSNWRTVPALGAVIGFITFIASMITSVSPALTVAPGMTNGADPGSPDK
jgi:hypothetical protein